MKICLVTAFPPSREALNEYGFHIARELQLRPGLDLTILADDYSGPEPELEGFSVIRCWKFNSLRNPVRLIRCIREMQPDVVWFNLGFASFGGKPLPAFVGIGTPAMVRAAGFYTHVTLHQLMETVDLKDAGIRFPFLYKAAGFVATQILLFANSISVLLPAYRSLIREKYRRGSVHVRRHGILSGRPEYPDFSRRGNPEHRILAFGKWGTYKRLEPMIEAFDIVASKIPNVHLVIAGTDHPKAPGYLQSVADKCQGRPHIKFAGYVEEEAISDLFQSTSVAVMPYTSSAGSSGVAHLACAYGVPMIASDIPDFQQLATEEGLAIQFFRTGDVQGMAECIVEFLQNPERQLEMSIQNFSAALRMSMPEIIRQYLRTFDLQRHLNVLMSVSRLRRLPRWLPMRGKLLRAATRRHLAQMAIPTASSDINPPLVHSQSNGCSDMVIPGVTVDRDVEDSNWTLRLVKLADGVQSTAAGGQKPDQHEGNGQDTSSSHRRFGSESGNGQSHYAEGCDKHVRPGSESSWDMRLIGPECTRPGNGKGGIRGVTSWSDDRGREEAEEIFGQPGAGESDSAGE
jgi:glycosyltransferase involved in cell wall biosynthesis